MATMRVAVVGAAGRTGRLVAEGALEAGHAVTAVVRDRSRLPVSVQGAVRVVTADVRDHGALRGAFEGHDVVVTALGTAGRGATTVFSAGAREVVAACAADGVGHVLAMSSAGLDSGHLPFAERVVTRLVVDRLYREIHRDLARMEEGLAGSPVPWTVVRVPMLKDGPASERPRAVYDAPLPRAGTATRATVAAWIVGHLGDPAAFRRQVTLADG
ncbi:NAD(P)-dependent oxidoreductase [Streptomyces sp. NPDC086989]|uniref:NAD(P)-dependent oxidoreductase n=1 Tax=Streptomyces sp. NPDC086989 TaxID=3365764 RepID=UPI00380333EB